MNKSRSSIIDSLPASVVNLLLSVEKRLMNDWGVISKTLKKFPKLLPPLDMELIRDRHLQMGDFVWGWLNVNTRCVYHDLGFQQSDDNMTMCPLLDFANHTPLQSMSITKDEFALCDGMAFSSSTHLKPGDEVHLRYGGHSNAVLFTEYGFVLPIDTRNAHTINGEMSIDFDVEELFKLCQDHATKSQLLKDWNYWGYVVTALCSLTVFNHSNCRDWTLHVEDGVGRPSFRLLPTLRLFHVSLEPTPNRDLEFWENTLLGLADIVSAENESKVRDSIMALCRQIIGRSVVKVPLVQSKISAGQRRVGDGDEGYLQVLRMAKSLCEEERLIAELVEKSIVDGVQF
ncbi:hypothetical protein FRC07_003992 [Ceratobasidium sp. 392]|nr:hypothetical protein FRC07_003992 [Ceratobasidium sp. 392]